MNLSIKNTIYQGVIRKKWINITYLNSKKEETNFYIGVIDINVDKEIIYCDIFNPFKSNEVLENKNGVPLKINNILTASILEHTFYKSSETLLNKFKEGNKLEDYLEVVNFDNNILRYLSDCYRLDNDPFLKEIIMIDGIDLHTLAEAGKYNLDEEQFDVVLRKIFKVPAYEAEKINRYRTLGINVFSIDYFDKEYVVAYRTLQVDFKHKTLKLSEETFINKSFLISEDKKITLKSYLDMDEEVFCKSFASKKEEYIQAIENNFHQNEMVNTRPMIFFLERNTNNSIEETLDAIYKMDKENNLSFPLKSFFGRNKCRDNINKEAEIVVFDKKKINIDQLRVVSNSMVNHVTYVKGPPGTGKTETIFNVLLSAYANSKKVLVVSNNNHPVDDIYRKMSESFENVKTFLGDDYIFPMLRIENYADTIKTITFLRKVLEYISKRKGTLSSDDFAEMNKNNSLSAFRELKRYIKEYEEVVNLKERKDYLEKIKELASINNVVNQKIDEQIKIDETKIEEKKNIESINIMDYVSSMNENSSFCNYLYFSTLNRYKKTFESKL